MRMLSMFNDVFFIKLLTPIKPTEDCNLTSLLAGLWANCDFASCMSSLRYKLDSLCPPLCLFTPSC